MATEVFYTTGRLNDRQIVKMMKAICDSFGKFNLAYRFGDINLDVDELDEVIRRKKSFTIDAADLSTDEHMFVLRYRRGTSALNANGQPIIDQRISSPYFDEVIITPGRGGNSNTHLPSATQIHDLTQLIEAHLVLKSANASNSHAGSAIDVLQAELADLSSLHTKMVEQSHAERTAFAEERAKIFSEMREELRTKREEHDVYIFEEETRIKILEREVEAKQKKLDDRDHMHVRRQLRESITSEIKNRVAGSMLPKETSRLNFAICIGSLLIACVAGYFAFSSFSTFDNLITSVPATIDGNLQTWLVAEFLRGSLSSFACIGFLVYTVSWLRRTYVSNVKAAQDLQKYSLDINRASWTIETIMEMTNKEGRILPDRWIEGACHGLFQTSEQDHAEITPMEAWTALLSGAAKVQHGPEGTTLELNGKDARKMTKSQKN